MIKMDDEYLVLWRLHKFFKIFSGPTIPFRVDCLGLDLEKLYYIVEIIRIKHYFYILHLFLFSEFFLQASKLFFSSFFRIHLR